MIANAQGKKDQPEGGVEQFSSAGRDYFRATLARAVLEGVISALSAPSPTVICWSGMRLRLTGKDWKQF